ncbi:MAG: MazG family protein [Clostridia bacterium]|nr:MazG family protein [Clostridia bacterium]
MITVVSIGPGDPSFLNEITVRTLRDASPLVLRTGRHPLSVWLETEGMAFRTLDHLYETSDDFDALSRAAAEELWSLSGTSPYLVYAVSDVLTDRTVDALFSSRPEGGEVRLVPGFSFADYYLPACRPFFSTADIRICPAASFDGTGLQPSRPLLITELNDEITAGEVKQALAAWIRDEETVMFLPGDGKALPVPLYELDRQPFYDHLSAVACGPFSYEQRSRKTLEDLMEIMDRLRAPGGCPWDRKQTHQSLEPYVVEEAWEVVGAAEENDPLHLAEELGDLLFQVVFHTSIGKSFDEFTMDDVLSAICQKMIRRHPHVFAPASGSGATDAAVELPEAGTRITAEQVTDNWDKIKQAETGSKTPLEALKDVSPALPALRYAEKVLRKMKHVPALPDPAPAEITESIRSLAEDLDPALPVSELEKRFAALLFACSRLSAALGLDSEILLHEFTARLIRDCQTLEK